MNTDDIIRMAKEVSGDDWGMFKKFIPEVIQLSDLLLLPSGRNARRCAMKLMMMIII